MGFKNKKAQNHVKDFVVQGVANLTDINNPQVGDTAFVLDTCDTYVYKGDPDPLVSPIWRLYIQASTGGSDDQTAAEVPFTPDGDITSTNVQDAIVEVRNDTDTKLADKVVGSVTPVTDKAIARYDGTTGYQIEDSLVLINDDGSLNMPLFTSARTSADKDAWLEKIGAGPLFFKCNVGGTVHCVELSPEQ